MKAPLHNLSSCRFLVSVALVALAIRVFRIAHQSLWVDEVLTLIASTSHDGYSVFVRILHNIHGPLHSFVVFLFQSVSTNTGWMRAPGAIAGTAAVCAVYYWVRRWIGESTARITALLLALSPLHVYYSQELRNYAFVLCFGVLANVAFERFHDVHRNRETTHMASRFVCYVLAIAAALLSNFSAAFLFAAHTLIWLVRERFARRGIVRWVAVILVVVVLTSPWIYRVTTYIDVSRLVTPVVPGQIDTTERLRGATTFTPLAIPYALYTFSAGLTLGPSLRELHTESPRDVCRDHALAIGLVALVFGALALLGIRDARRRHRLFELGVYLLLPIAGTLALGWQNAKAFNVRYVLVALPAWLVLVSLGLERLRKPFRWVFGGALATIFAVSLFHLYFTPRYAREDVRDAVAYIRDHGSTDPCVLAPTVFHVARYYAPSGMNLMMYFGSGHRDEQISRVVATCNTLWYIRARAWVDDPDGYLLEHLADTYPKQQLVEFPGVELFRLTR